SGPAYTPSAGLASGGPGAAIGAGACVVVAARVGVGACAGAGFGVELRVGIEAGFAGAASARGVAASGVARGGLVGVRGELASAWPIDPLCVAPPEVVAAVTRAGATAPAAGVARSGSGSR
ncbi:MAG TPA: hypothetical protein VN738_01225, partial [Acidothermaceae bacterium]|nr:hypothetical protein [Acidothermaceae bacterium]